MENKSNLLKKVLIGTGKAAVGFALLAGLAELTSEQTVNTGTYLGDSVTKNGKLSQFRPLGATDSMSDYSVKGGEELEKGKVYTSFEKNYFFGLTKSTDSIVPYNKH